MHSGDALPGVGGRMASVLYGLGSVLCGRPFFVGGEALWESLGLRGANTK
jgi:hypothetical protein